MRRSVIMAIMCQGELRFEVDRAALPGIRFREYFARRTGNAPGEGARRHGTADRSGLTVTAQGWYFVRGIAMLFDKYLQDARSRTKFSKII